MGSFGDFALHSIPAMIVAAGSAATGPALAAGIDDFAGIWTRDGTSCQRFIENGGSETSEFLQIAPDHVSRPDGLWCPEMKSRIAGAAFIMEGKCEDAQGRSARTTAVFQLGDGRLVDAGTGDSYERCLSQAELDDLDCKSLQQSIATTVEINIQEAFNRMDTDAPEVVCNFYRAYVDEMRYGLGDLQSLNCNAQKHDLAGLREMLAQHEPIEKEFCTPGKEKRLPF